MLKKQVTPQETVDFLNSLLEVDQGAIAELFEYRVRCGESLGEHETVQTIVEAGKYKVGILGILNGLFGVNENKWGCIFATYDDHGELQSFSYNPDAK